VLNNAACSSALDRLLQARSDWLLLGASLQAEAVQGTGDRQYQSSARGR
jgi:hypothetical protein